MAHICPAGQGSGIAWQSPAAVQVWRVRVLPLQVVSRQLAPARSRRQPPMPSQPLLQASSRQVPVGSVPRAGTGTQVPCDPSTLQARQVPLQAVAQQRPCAQMPGAAQSLSRLHRAPTGRLPQEPSMQVLGEAHCESLPHWVTQRLPLHPLNGAQLRALGTSQLPPRHTPAPVSVLAAASQRPDRQEVPSR
jgi:hypothetical protein